MDKRLVEWTRLIFGGNVVVTIICPHHRPQMGIIRPKVFKKPQEDFTKVGKIIKFKTTVEEKDLKTKIIKTIKNNEVNCNLEEAKIIVAGGRGLQLQENFILLKELASVLGGVVGASRAVVDVGLIPLI